MIPLVENERHSARIGIAAVDFFARQQSVRGGYGGDVYEDLYPLNTTIHVTLDTIDHIAVNKSDTQPNGRIL